jgi:hypothetical protein
VACRLAEDVDGAPWRRGEAAASTRHGRPLAQALDGIDPHLGDGVRVLRRDRLDLHTTLRREHAQVLLGGAVEGDGGVVLLADVGGDLDPHQVDRVALDVHAEDVAGVLPRFGRVVGQLDPARLAPPTDVHLCLDHHRVPDAIGDGDRVVDGLRVVAGRHRDAELGEELFALKLQQIHERSSRAPRPCLLDSV